MKIRLLSKNIQIQLFLVLVVLTFTGLLSIFAVKGVYSRYAQDDYCYGYRVRENGFWKNQVDSYFHLTEYSPNRYSLTFFVNLAELLGGPRFVIFLPGLEIIAWAFSLVYLLMHLLRRIEYRLIISIMAALVLLYYIYYLSPEPYQNFYWLSSIHSYLTPLVLTTFIFGRCLHFSFSNKFTFINGLELGLLCLLAGGFSETAAAWQFSLWIIAILWIFIFQRNTFFPKAKWPLTVILFSTFLAMVVLFICPTNSIKAGNFERLDFLTIIGRALVFGEEFIRVSIKSAPIPFAVVFFFGFWTSSLARKSNGYTFRDYLRLKIIVLVSLYLLSVSTMLPYLYVMGVYPGDRALLPAHFSLITGLFSFGWIIAQSIFALWVKNKPVKLSRVFFAILGVVLLAYSIRSGFFIAHNLEKFQARAQAWDLRQQMIMDAKAAGEMDIIVPQFDSIYGITELKPDPENWVNMCAAKYYQVKSITAIENYQGIPVHSIGE